VGPVDWEVELVVPADPGTGDIATVREHATLADQLGYDSVNCSHIAARDSFTTLAGLAHLAPSVTLATSVAPIYHRSPASMAQTAATVDDLSGGRFGLPFYRAMFAQAGYEADVAAGVARYRATGATNPMITNITGTDLGATMRAAISD
jgi:alkanesulfonate monooxygenase SsuD/methylene tetrahydromethanopterin reductase-like flavin-dependent oxidoreductase (luciferase family)